MNLPSLLTFIERWPHEHQQVRAIALDTNLRRLDVGSWALAAINFFCFVLFGLLLSFDSTSQQRWASDIALAHLLMGVLMVGVNRLLHARPDYPFINQRINHLPEVIVGLLLVWAVGIGVLDVRQGLGLHAYQNTCIAVAMALLLRPGVALALWTGITVLMMICLNIVITDGDVLTNHVFNVLMTNALGMLSSILLWRSFVQTQLQQQALIQTNQLLEKQQTELQALATTDELTGLLNRRALMQRAEIELRRVRRDAAPLSLLIVDIDHFRRINDKWGHPAGDAVLRHVAQFVRKAVRDTDVVARFGGEEFVLLLPGASQEAAHRLADELRLHIATSTLWWTPTASTVSSDSRPKDIDLSDKNAQSTPITITVSMGLICLPQGREANIDTLLGLTDQALHRAKYLGRNRVEVALLV